MKIAIKGIKTILSTGPVTCTEKQASAIFLPLMYLSAIIYTHTQLIPLISQLCKEKLQYSVVGGLIDFFFK